MNPAMAKMGGAATGERPTLRRLRRGLLDTNDETANVTQWTGPEVSDPFDRAIEWTLIGLLAFMPLALGAVYAWSELVVMIGAAGLGVMLALKLIVRRGAKFVWSWTYVPVGVFIGLVAVQLLPLPAGIIGAVSSGTVRLKQELLGDLPNAGDALRRMTLSFYPHATARDLRLVLAAATIFVVVVNVFRRSKQIVRLLTGVAIIGGAIAALAVLQNVTGAREVYWSIYNGEMPVTGGTFVNQNNFSQFMNLSIGAALAVLLVRLREVMGAGGKVLSRVKVYAGDPELRLAWGMGAVVIVGALSVILSMSRMGTVSLLVGGALAGAVLALRRDDGARAWVLAPIALALFAALLWAGFDKVYDRLATLRKLEQADSGSRWQTLVDLQPVWRGFPVLGIGSGAHETFYPMFDHHPDPALTAHVENDYAQALEETGAVGLATVAAFVVMVWVAWWRGLRAVRVPVQPATVGLGSGLAAVIIQSAADFGQHLPAVAGLSAVTCGLLVVLGQKARAARGPESEPHPHVPARVPPARVFALIGLVLAFGWALTGSVSAARAESHWMAAESAEAHLAKHGWEQAGEEELQQLLRHAADATDADPGNVHYRHEAAALRWRVIATDPNRQDKETGDLLLTQEDVDEVRDIVDRLHQARRVCPSYGANLAIAGRLERFVLDDRDAGLAHIRQGYRLSPNNPSACFVAGYLDAIEGRVEESVVKMRSAVRLSPGTFDDVVNLYLGQVERPDLAVEVAGADAGRLMKVAEALQARPQLAEQARQVKARAIAKLRERTAQADASATTLAQMADVLRKDGDQPAAIDFYRRALALDYGQVNWRLELAQALAQSGDAKQAIKELEICLRLRPRWAPAEKLIGDFSVLPGAAPE
jgi:tetratricopeptide (TPR) repeat protein